MPETKLAPFNPQRPHVVVFADPQAVTTENIHGVRIGIQGMTDHELVAMLLSLGAAQVAQNMYDRRKFSQHVVLPDGSPAPLPVTPDVSPTA